MCILYMYICMYVYICYKIARALSGEKNTAHNKLLYKWLTITKGKCEQYFFYCAINVNPFFWRKNNIFLNFLYARASIESALFWFYKQTEKKGLFNFWQKYDNIPIYMRCMGEQLVGTIYFFLSVFFALGELKKGIHFFKFLKNIYLYLFVKKTFYIIRKQYVCTNFC